MPIATIATINQDLNKSYNTTHRILTKFVDFGIVSQSSDKRYKQYRFDLYLALLEKEY